MGARWALGRALGGWTHTGRVGALSMGARWARGRTLGAWARAGHGRAMGAWARAGHGRTLGAWARAGHGRALGAWAHTGRVGAHWARGRALGMGARWARGRAMGAWAGTGCMGRRWVHGRTAPPCACPQPSCCTLWGSPTPPHLLRHEARDARHNGHVDVGEVELLAQQLPRSFLALRTPARRGFGGLTCGAVVQSNPRTMSGADVVRGDALLEGGWAV
eukprot:244872-Chlamydomonas_euryale.AAC.3